jgi:hypothetical protein
MEKFHNPKMQNNQVSDEDQAPDVGWFRGQELPLQLGLATFLYLAATISIILRSWYENQFRTWLQVQELMDLEDQELMYHVVCLVAFLIFVVSYGIVTFVVLSLWFCCNYCLIFLILFFWLYVTM